VTFEDLAIVGGPNFGSCLLNETWGAFGDAIHMVARRVRFLGNGVTTTSGIYLSDASYSTVDGSYFSGLKYSISSAETIDGTNGSYVDNLVITNSIFYSRSTFAGGRYASVDSNPMIYLPAKQGVMGLHMTGNAFELGPAGIEVSLLEGGDITGNWFRGEGTDSPGTGTWISIRWGNGVVVAANYIDLGYDGILSQAYGEVIQGNYFRDWFGTGITLQAGDAVVHGNTFWESVEVHEQVDIDVVTGTGHQIGPNASTGAPRLQLRLRSGTGGILFMAPSLASHVKDESSGGWTSVIDGRLPEVGTPHDQRRPTTPSPQTRQRSVQRP
jgi:hypothetical protein